QTVFGKRPETVQQRRDEGQRIVSPVQKSAGAKQRDDQQNADAFENARQRHARDRKRQRSAGIAPEQLCQLPNRVLHVRSRSLAPAAYMPTTVNLRLSSAPVI